MNIAQLLAGAEHMNISRPLSIAEVYQVHEWVPNVNIGIILQVTNPGNYFYRRIPHGCNLC